MFDRLAHCDEQIVFRMAVTGYNNRNLINNGRQKWWWKPGNKSSPFSILVRGLLIANDFGLFWSLLALLPWIKVSAGQQTHRSGSSKRMNHISVQLSLSCIVEVINWCNEMRARPPVSQTLITWVYVIYDFVDFLFSCVCVSVCGSKRLEC